MLNDAPPFNARTVARRLAANRQRGGFLPHGRDQLAAPWQSQTNLCTMPHVLRGVLEIGGSARRRRRSTVITNLLVHMIPAAIACSATEIPPPRKTIFSTRLSGQVVTLHNVRVVFHRTGLSFHVHITVTTLAVGALGLPSARDTVAQTL